VPGFGRFDRRANAHKYHVAVTTKTPRALWSLRFRSNAPSAVAANMSEDGSGTT
jgi:hypothetical protein